MASYVKIWTSVLYDEKFLALSLPERGAFLQLIIAAKLRDDGYINVANVQQLGSMFGCDPRTAVKIVTRLQQVCNVIFKKASNGVITIHLPKYSEWQEVTAKDVATKSKASTVNVQQYSSLLDQTRPKKTKPDHTILKTGKPSARQSFVEAVELFVVKCPGLPKPKRDKDGEWFGTTTGYRRLANRLKDLDKLGMNLSQYFDLIAGAPFLNGESDRGWRASYDWTMKSENFLKVTGGNYDDKRKQGQSQHQESGPTTI